MSGFPVAGIVLRSVVQSVGTIVKHSKGGGGAIHGLPVPVVKSILDEFDAGATRVIGGGEGNLNLRTVPVVCTPGAG